MKRCFELATLGAGSVSPNPMVGAVLVHKNRIIGEGFHAKYGADHAEVQAIKSVSSENRNLIPHSTLYVSLEPCCVYGNTPPCTSLILENQIKHLVISTLDSSPGVDGKGVEILKNAGVKVEINVLKKMGEALFRPRKIYVEKKRPYLILKFAQTENGQFCHTENQQTWISNNLSARIVHKWRKEADAILIGTNTAMIDNPKLTNRLYFGKSPVRIAIDRELKIPVHYHLFDMAARTIIVTDENSSPPSRSNVEYLQLDFSQNIIPDLLKYLHQQKIGSLIVEGGIQLLNSFIELNLWDEARVLRGAGFIADGRPAPAIPIALEESFQIDSDKVLIYYNLC